MEIRLSPQIRRETRRICRLLTKPYGEAIAKRKLAKCLLRYHASVSRVEVSQRRDKVIESRLDDDVFW